VTPESTHRTNPLSLLTTITGSLSSTLQQFKLKWALKKIARKLHSFSVPHHNYSNEAAEEWEKKVGEPQLEHQQESKWLLRHSDWSNRVLQLLTVIIYLSVCWYVSVDAIFGVGSRSSLPLMAVWLAVLLVDISLNLNTVKLAHGKSLRTRQAILGEYLRR
jgi:hypothetical protein